MYNMKKLIVASTCRKGPVTTLLDVITLLHISMKCESVSYMNCKLRKPFYKRNMGRNKYKYGQMYQEEDRTHHNQVVSLHKNVDGYISF